MNRNAEFDFFIRAPIWPTLARGGNTEYREVFGIMKGSEYQEYQEFICHLETITTIRIFL